ncbi:hypothetical protein GTU71_10585 [Rathayibacter sp. VKM Ac-2762]|uniref:SGNH/GDSL hydrolase family protein n=1 Tax=Rathayibacter sp. VKM Ac-2762 TaxID=2609254 RepID=UPI00132E9373|nr:SGNH/GDSL hydrolase family protein [Rathayibacter sp. VKM Ac-2762]QHF21232.1 hypothetical protein GTU71_10585 [Rathayibacter sp. VKM Ac-2762]
MTVTSRRSTTHRRWRAALGAGLGAAALFGSLLVAGPAQAAGTQTLLALGDSISRGAGTCNGTGDCVASNWSTGTNPAVDSIAARLEASSSTTSLTTVNAARSGSFIGGVGAKIDEAVAAGAEPDYVTLLIGGNDLCQTYDMTSVAGFTSSAKGVMSKIASAWPDATVLVGSVPNIAAEWNTVKATKGAVIWQAADLCGKFRGVNEAGVQQTGTQYTALLAEAASRATAYNRALSDACAATTNDCRWDGGALSRMAVPASAVSTVDYFHPSVSGQATIARTTWEAWGLSGDSGGTPTPTPTPGADTTAPSVVITSPTTGTTVGSSVTFVASSTDDVATTRVSFWSGSTRLGDATRASNGTWRLTVSTSAYPSGTFSITARAFDAAGNEGRSTAISIRH